MWRGLEDVGPDVVHEVSEGVFTAKAVHPECHVLHSPAGCLPVDQVPGGGGGGKDTRSAGYSCIVPGIMLSL